MLHISGLKQGGFAVHCSPSDCLNELDAPDLGLKTRGFLPIFHPKFVEGM